MHILVVHQYYLGKGEAGGSRFNQFAKHWAQAGHEVTVICGMVHYATGRKDPKYKGKVFLRETDGPGVNVIRCHVSESYHRGPIGRLWGYLTFTFFATWAGLFLARRPDVVIATSPPLLVALAMWLVSAGRRAPAIFEVRDLHPDSLIDLGLMKGKLTQKVFYKLEWIGYHRSRWINVLTPAFRTWLIERKGIPPSRMSMIPNAADIDLMRPGPRDNAVRAELGLEGKFVVSYFGAHGLANGLGQLLDVAALVRQEMPDVRIMLIGAGPEKERLIERARREGLDNVVFIDPVAKERVGDYINASDVCTAVLLNNPHYRTVYPNKVFDYMCCARPIIIGIDGVARELVESAGAGLFAEPANPQSFRAALAAIRGDPARAEAMGRAGREFVRKNFDRQVLARQYLDVMQKLAADGRTDQQHPDR